MNKNEEKFEITTAQKDLSSGKKIFGIIMIVLSSLALLFSAYLLYMFIAISVDIVASGGLAALGYIIALPFWFLSLGANIILLIVNIVGSKNPLVKIALFIILGSLLLNIVSILIFVFTNKG